MLSSCADPEEGTGSGPPWKSLKYRVSVNYFYWPFQGGTSFVDHLCYFWLCFLYSRECLIIVALWSPAGKELTSWLSFVKLNCEFVTLPLVSWVKCGAWLYRILIFAPFLIFLSNTGPYPLKKSQSYQASIQCWVIIGNLSKRHLNGVSLAADDGPLIIVFGSYLLSSTKIFKKKLDPLTKFSGSAHVASWCIVQQSKSSVCNKPLIMQWGVALRQVSSAIQVRVEVDDIVYPESQVNDATDI